MSAPLWCDEHMEPYCPRHAAPAMTAAPEWATHVTIWNAPRDTPEAAHAFAMRIAADGGWAVEVREVGA